MKADLGAGQLLSMSLPGMEAVLVARELGSLLPSSSKKLAKWTGDFLERHNVKISFKPSNSEFLISKLSKLEPDSPNSNETCSLGYFANFVTGEVFSVDFATMRVDKVMDNYADEAPPSSLFLKTKDFILRNQLSSEYQVFENGDSEVLVIGGITELNQTNFWSIHNSSRWTVRKDSSSGTYKVSGEVSVSVHYFENCNFHYQVGPIQIRAKSGLVDIESVFRRINVKINRTKLRISNQVVMAEAEFDNGTTASAHSSGRISAVMGIQPTSIVKRLRRQLPVHKAKFDWNVARMHLIGNLG
jgi:hypothetical protein